MTYLNGSLGENFGITGFLSARIEFPECVELSTEVCPQCTSGLSTCTEFDQCFNPGECHATFISVYNILKSNSVFKQCCINCNQIRR